MSETAPRRRLRQTSLSGNIVNAYTFAFIPDEWPPLIYRETECEPCGW